MKSCPIFILAGGMGTRISEETLLKPKPMIEVGGIPIILHLMRSYYAYGFNDFVICAGYRSWEIKEYFLNYRFRIHHLQIDAQEDGHGIPTVFGNHTQHERWKVRIIETGLESMTGARIAKAYDEIQKVTPFENFGVTYGDGLADVNLDAEFDYHLSHKKIGTVLGTHPVSRFGELEVENGSVVGFAEKPETNAGMINGGFFFFRKEFRKFLSDNPDCILERAPLSGLTDAKQLAVYQHKGFWQPMDTLRDKNHLQAIWDKGNAPWLPEQMMKNLKER